MAPEIGIGILFRYGGKLFDAGGIWFWKLLGNSCIFEEFRRPWPNNPWTAGIPETVVPDGVIISLSGGIVGCGRAEVIDVEIAGACKETPACFDLKDIGSF